MSQNKIEAFKKDFEELCKEYNVKLSLEYTDDFIHERSYKKVSLVIYSKGQQYAILTKELT